MISAIFLNQYIDFRLSFSRQVELYIIDQVQKNEFEIIIKDNGKQLEDNELESARDKINALDLVTPDKYYQYYHKGQNTLQIDINYNKTKVSLENLNSIVGMLMLRFPEKELIFTYLSPKGEYFLNSGDFLSRFTNTEIASKEFALYLNEILQNHLDEVIFSNTNE